MAVGTGIGIDLDALNKALKQADDALLKLYDTGEKVSDRLIKTLLNVGSRGIDPFVSKLQEQKDVLETLSQIKMEGLSGGMKKVVRDVQNMLDATNKEIEAVTKLNEAFSPLIQARERSKIQANAIYNADAALHDLKIIDDQIKAAEEAEKTKIREAERTHAARQKEYDEMGQLLNEEDRLRNELFNAQLERIRKENEARQKAIQDARNAEIKAHEDRQREYDEMGRKLQEYDKMNASSKASGQRYAAEYEERTRYYERWINEEFLKEQENNKKIAESKLAEERRINQQISQDRIDQLGRESQQRQKIEQMIRDTQKRNHDAREKELNDLFREQERQLKAQAKADSETRKLKYKAYTTSYAGAIYTSDHANTLAKEIKAVKNLEAARAKLNKTDTNYQKKLDDINARILQHNKNIQEATAGAKEHEKAHSSLGSKIATVFSVQAIRGYLNQMIKVRGEMELQQRALQAIVQNKAAANEVWQKTIDLAVRSPFRIKDLVTYTKQLAAYRVESEKLYDTNKMLADVSAGLGVDMNRLILAFGQVKSANFLRGTELRQFTEAGIPMLDELAKLYEQMEGATVTAADVFDRISKRMVLFEDVEEVLKRMTAAGGTFYRMQEIQSETLKGQISNLKDSVDIMLNSMGKDTDGVLKNGVKSVKFLVDNYQALIPVLKAIIAALALYKINTFQASSATLMYARNLGVAKASASGLGAIWATLRVSLNKFKVALGETVGMLTAHPWLLLIAAIAAAAFKLNQFRKELEEVDKKYSQLLDKQGDVYLAFRQAGQKGDLEEQVAERRKQLQALVDMAKNEYGLVIDINVRDIDESKLEEEFNKIRQKMLETNAFSAKFTKEMIKSDKLSKWFGEELIYEEGLFKDIQDVGDSYEKLYQEMITKSGRITEKLRDDWGNLTDVQKKAVEDLERPIQGSENMVDYVERLKNAFLALNNTNAVKENGKISRFIRRLSRDAREAKVEFSLFASRFREEVDAISDEKEKVEFLDVSIGAMADEKMWSEFEENYIRRLVEQEFGITFVPKTATPEELKNWQKSYNALFTGDSGFREITSAATSQSQVIERLNGTYESLKETITRIEAAGKDSVLAGGAYEGQDLNKLKNDLAEIKKQLDWFGAEDKKVLEKLKNRISLIKEMNKEYEKLNKTFSKAESLAKVQKAYADTAKELGLDSSKMDFTDEGTIKSLEALLGKPEYAANKYVIELQKALDNFKVELGIEVKQEKDKDLKAQVEGLFDQYDLSLELKKLNIPKDLAKSLFDVDYLDLDGLKKAVQAQEVKFVGTDMEDEYKKFLEKIDDMEDKAAKERMKTYVKYLQEGMSERVKLKIEELGKLKDIEDSEYSEEQKRRIKQGISKEAKKAQQKQEWEDFKGTEMYTMMFEDLEFLGTKSLEVLKRKLEELKRSLSDLDASEVKEIIGQINKIEDVMIARSPFKYMKELKAQLKTMKSEEEYQFTLINAQKQEQEAQEVINVIDTVQGAMDRLGVVEAYKVIDEDTLQEYMRLSLEAVKQGKTLKDIRKEKEGIVENAQKEGQEATDNLNTYKQVDKTLQEQISAWNEIGGKIGDVFNASKEIMESLGVGTDSVAMSLVESGQAMTSLIVSAITFGKQMKIMGYETNMALGVIGWVAMGVQAIATVLTAIANYKNAKIDDQLEQQAKTIELQRDLYEQLEEKIDSAYDVAQLRQYNNEMKRNIDLEIQALQASIALERSRKNADEDQIADWQKEIEEARERLAESTQDMMEELGGVFDLTDFTSSFVDAWWDAMNEGKSGLDALGQHFEDTMKDMVKKQALYQGANAIMKQVQDAINKSLEGDYSINQGEWDTILAAAKKANVDLDAFLQGYRDLFGTISDSAGGSLSELQKGIQGVTEDTAQIIEAYLNSIRGYVSEQVTYTKRLYEMFDRMSRGTTYGLNVRMIS